MEELFVPICIPALLSTLALDTLISTSYFLQDAQTRVPRSSSSGDIVTLHPSFALFTPVYLIMYSVCTFMVCDPV